MIDEIVSQADGCITCRKTFQPAEYFFAGHYPDFPLVPGVLLCEAALQAGAVLLAGAAKEAGGVPVATRLNDVRFKQMVRPGDTIEIEVTLNERLANAFYMTGKITLGGKLAARLEFACTMAERGRV